MYKRSKLRFAYDHPGSLLLVILGICVIITIVTITVHLIATRNRKIDASSPLNPDSKPGDNTCNEGKLSGNKCVCNGNWLGSKCDKCGLLYNGDQLIPGRLSDKNCSTIVSTEYCSKTKLGYPSVNDKFLQLQSIKTSGSLRYYSFSLVDFNTNAVSYNFDDKTFFGRLTDGSTGFVMSLYPSPLWDGGTVLDKYPEYLGPPLTFEYNNDTFMVPKALTSGGFILELFYNLSKPDVLNTIPLDGSMTPINKFIIYCDQTT